MMMPQNPRIDRPVNPPVSKQPPGPATTSAPFEKDELNLDTAAHLTFVDRSYDPPAYGKTTGKLRLLMDTTLTVGRYPDSNMLVFPHSSVSRNHCEFFSIFVDDEHHPMVYVRDRGSRNGTYVNGILIGKGPIVSTARLLDHGDVVEMAPHITFRIHQPLKPNPKYALTPQQVLELQRLKNKYVVGSRTIGDGCHATVHVGLDVSTGRQIVCKVHDLKKAQNAGPDSLRRIRQEAYLMSYLDHPHILAFKQAFESSDNLYMFMELATGGDLFSLMWRQQMFTDFEIRLILRQLLRGVEHLHAKGIAHRDIKPENILCAVSPAVSHRIVLADLGHAGVPSRGRMKSNVGTAVYRAPESWSVDEAHTVAVDLWSIGVLTLQLLIGPVPLPTLHSANEALFATQVSACLSHLRGGGLSMDCKAFIHGCLTFDGHQRFTAQQALNHPWLQEPMSDREAFEELEKQLMESWRPRELRFPIIQRLDGGTLLGPVATTGGLHNDLEDASDERLLTSPHFASPSVARIPLQRVKLHAEPREAEESVLHRQSSLLSPAASSPAAQRPQAIYAVRHTQLQDVQPRKRARTFEAQTRPAKRRTRELTGDVQASFK